jgi:hypothetical protein
MPENRYLLNFMQVSIVTGRLTWIGRRPVQIPAHEIFYRDFPQNFQAKIRALD